MRIYAADSDLPPAVSAALGAGSAAYLREASILVETATMVDVYDVDESGKPTDSTVAQAFLDATVAQVEFWVAAKVNPAGGVLAQAPDVTSQSSDGSSVSYGSNRNAEALGAAISTLCGTAFSILRLAGLTASNAKPLLT